jgi:hypothetical protein
MAGQAALRQYKNNEKGPHGGVNDGLGLKATIRRLLSEPRRMRDSER